MREMKNSTIEWLGMLPNDWNFSKIGALYSLRNEKVSDKDYAPLSVTNKGIMPQLETAAKTNAHDDRKLVKKGDFAINSRSDRRGSCGISAYDGSVSLINIILKPMVEMNPEYYDWLFHTTQFGDEYYKWGHGIVDDLWTTGWQEMKKITIPFPPIGEQEKIATFLNKKCSDIDALSADIQKQVDDLEEYRSSIIAEAVTLGLNTLTDYIDPHINWVKQIPKHWKIIPSKYMFYNSDARKKKSDVLLTASQRHGIISQTKYMELENAKIVLANQGIESWKHVEPNDFVISLRSFQGGLEMSEVEGCITWHYVVLKSRNKIVPRYYRWLFKSLPYIKALQGTCNFIRDGQDLRYSNFSQVCLFYPPLDEQEQIADYLDKKCGEIDATIEEKKKQIDTLDEMKKSVIYEYVTGKKEVPAV